ncbi:MAG TPA: hypothetical protein VFJ55_00285 [Chthoniobacterales bacterium]|nr:hypothetical protein [Chthoniobacterales bacterium]
MGLRSFCSIAAVVAASAVAQTPTSAPLPSQAESVEGVILPVPKEIFRSLDKFRDANWRAVERPEIAKWKSHGDQAQIAVLLGVVIGEGFIAMEAEDAIEVKQLGTSVLKLARALGVEESALRRSKSIMEFATRGDWTAARQEWDGVLSDLEAGMVRLKSVQLAQLVSLGGWLRGTEALSALVLQNYSSEGAELFRQPVLAESLEKEILGMSGNSLLSDLRNGLDKIRGLIADNNQPLTDQTVRQIHDVCSKLVQLAARGRS